MLPCTSLLIMVIALAQIPEFNGTDRGSDVIMIQQPVWIGYFAILLIASVIGFVVLTVRSTRNKG